MFNSLCIIFVLFAVHWINLHFCFLRRRRCYTHFFKPPSYGSTIFFRQATNLGPSKKEHPLKSLDDVAIFNSLISTKDFIKFTQDLGLIWNKDCQWFLLWRVQFDCALNVIMGKMINYGDINHITSIVENNGDENVKTALNYGVKFAQE